MKRNDEDETKWNDNGENNEGNNDNNEKWMKMM